MNHDPADADPGERADRHGDPLCADAPASSRQLWLHVQHAKAFARVVRRAGASRYMDALNVIARASGYEDYADALHQPRPIGLSFETWRSRLCAQLGVDEDEGPAIEHLPMWFKDLHASSGRRAPPPPNARHGSDGDDGDSEMDACVLSLVSHEATVVNAIAAGDRSVRHRPAPGPARVVRRRTASHWSSP
jgi:hypothetical protein